MIAPLKCIESKKPLIIFCAFYLLENLLLFLFAIQCSDTSQKLHLIYHFCFHNIFGNPQFFITTHAILLHSQQPITICLRAKARIHFKIWLEKEKRYSKLCRSLNQFCGYRNISHYENSKCFMARSSIDNFAVFQKNDMVIQKTQSGLLSPFCTHKHNLFFLKIRQ